MRGISISPSVIAHGAGSRCSAARRLSSACARCSSLRVICHVADLGNCAINWQLSKVWALRVCDEAINQAHKEQMLGLPCGKLTPYTDEELNARQLVFVDGWVYPLFKAAAILYPGVKERLKDIAECREACKIVTKQNARNSASA